MYEQQPNPEQHPLAQGAQLPSGGILRHTSPQSGGQLAAPQADCPGSGDGGWGSSGGNEHAAAVLSHLADLDGGFAREPGRHMQSAAREHGARAQAQSLRRHVGAESAPDAAPAQETTLVCDLVVKPGGREAIDGWTASGLTRDRFRCRALAERRRAASPVGAQRP